MDKYEEKVEQLKRILPSWEKLSYNGKTFIQDLKYIFPELAESEDERIKNEIIAFVEQSIHRGGGTPIPQEQEHKWIAWLEKQNSNADNANKEYWRGYREGKQEILDKYAELEKQAEQKPNTCDGCINRKGCINCENGELREVEQKPVERISVSEELYEHIRNAHACMEDANCSDEELKPKWKQDRYDQAREDLEEAMKLISIEQKPAEWSEDDKYYHCVIMYLLNNECVGAKDKENAINWFKSLKERVTPQPKVEWSEEDEKMLDTVIEDIIRLAGPKVCYHKDVDWLKSLRPQKQWKPTEEQMEALDEYIYAKELNTKKYANAVLSLRDGLKKLI